MDPVAAGAAATVLVRIVSGAVQVAHHRLSAEVELARIADAGITERVRTPRTGARFRNME